MYKVLSVKVPSKVIISGEYLVLFKKEAIACSIDKYLLLTFESRKYCNFILFNFFDFNLFYSFNYFEVYNLGRYFYSKYICFLKGLYSITGVLNDFCSLFFCVFSYFIVRFNLTFNYGLKIIIKSNVSIGCGMGSSSSLILGFLCFFRKYFNLNISDSILMSLAKDLENFQHGISSGLDLKIIYFSDIIYFNKYYNLSISNFIFNLFLLDTGKPISSTGECVSHAIFFLYYTSFLFDFLCILRLISFAVIKNDWILFKEGIRRNSALLIKLQVVPIHIINFLYSLEFLGLFGKICGAGSIFGNSAGIVVFFSKKKYQFFIRSVDVVFIDKCGILLH